MATKLPSRPWADSPLILIPTPTFETKKEDMWTLGASHMCNMHNSIFRGYNSIYHQALLVQESDKPDFIGYCLTWYKFVTSHAAEEEAELFPKVEEVLKDSKIWGATHQEHDAFIPPLAEFHKYLTSLKSAHEFSGTKLVEIMATFQEPFEAHFRSEISTIADFSTHPNTPKEGSTEQKAAVKALDRWGRRTVIKAGITDVALFFLYNVDRTYEDGLWARWPEVPAPIKWGLVNVGGLLHSRWWRFASCDSSGKPRELYAVQLHTGNQET